ncbi:VOC family protein [Reinekea blandensis]|uniref:Glyoxalase/bleomycin resistance protein/dioxygenase superfamily protein n=1 Tax=Reinekea blandensis MED297 TaxID=314283 RepID=A4BGA0_9GAMM|nr:VOC family protein [Reinekea blandensis]EAR08895.1 glyoxalase/bleomycin resistance protein/dioxygenase superfamily protein [Reinekea sp. MED297] [Reinekea blandensis MED297]MBU2865135.1 VOC family protein [Reinekea forsetii]
MKPIANLIHVGDVSNGLDWYRKAFPMAIVKNIDDFTFLEVNGFALEIVPADEKVGSGKYGSVTYWEVVSLEHEIERFKELGSVVYRGPMKIESDLWMCQVTDPFGNLIGLRGPFNNHRHSDS